MDEQKERGPRRRLTGARRSRFLEVLAETGNRRMAAEAIGFDPRSMDQRRRYDPLLDRQWSDALGQADRRLAGIEGPYDPAAGEAPVVVVKRGKNKRLQLQKAGEKRWSRAVEDRFFATLAVCGNIAASARAVGFSESCVAQRRRRWPRFAERLEQALEDAELEVEFRMAAEVRRLGRDSHFPHGGAGSRPPAGGGDGCLGQSLVTVPSDCPRPFDMDAAIRFLKWREEKRRGGGRRGRHPARPSIEAVTDKIVRKVEAIKRHRRKYGGDGDSHK